VPATLVIPSLGVAAVVQVVGVDSQGNMATPTAPDKVAWYEPGPAPGKAGDAVVAGHLDWTSGPAVFWNLQRLARRDEVDVVGQDGRKILFRVTDTSNSNPGVTPGLAATAPTPVRLSEVSLRRSI
jgi:hypothetical protein